TARVSTYADVIEEYEYHPESKCADASGAGAGRQTIGLLQRRPVALGSIHPIGKESNSLEDVDARIEHDEDNVYTEYTDPRRTDWMRSTLPAVRSARLIDLVRGCSGKMSRRALIDIRAGRSTPHLRNQRLLAMVVRVLGLL